MTFFTLWKASMSFHRHQILAQSFHTQGATAIKATAIEARSYVRLGVLSVSAKRSPPDSKYCAVCRGAISKVETLQH